MKRIKLPLLLLVLVLLAGLPGSGFAPGFPAAVPVHPRLGPNGEAEPEREAVIGTPTAPNPDPVVIQDEKHDLSAPLRDIPPQPRGQSRLDKDKMEKEGLPKPVQTNNSALQPGQPNAAAVQDKAGPNTAPTPVASFEGINNVDGYVPPDTNGDVGLTHYVQWVNASFAIYRKSDGVKVYGPAAGNTLWASFGGLCESKNQGDPIVLYDSQADRWLMSQFAFGISGGNPIGPYYECIAISQTSDPTGAWYRYAFLWSANIMNDYPKLGVWPDGYYMTVNQFPDSGGWGGGGVAVLERSQMLQGLPARQVQFSLSTDYGGMLPPDWDGTTAPPAGAPAPFAEWDAGSLGLWNFHVDWTTPANSTFGLSGAPNQTITTTNVSTFDTNYSWVPQPGTTQKLDTLGDRLMHRLQYRNFGTYQALVANHTAKVGSGSGIHWFELRNTGSIWFKQQEGVYAPTACSVSDAAVCWRWMASIAMDKWGNIGLGYSMSSSGSTYPSIAFTGRVPGDTAGTFGQGEGLIMAGTGNQTTSYGRWGDYSMLSVDPVDDCTFWYTTEYILTSGDRPWRTRIAAFQMPGCPGSGNGTIAGTVRDQANSLLSGARVTVDSTTVVTGADGAFSFSLPAGSYSVKAVAYGYSTGSAPSVTVTSGVTTTQNFNLTAGGGTPVTIKGKVTDGSGHVGMPLYARVAVSGITAPFAVFTNPVTGNYSVSTYQDWPVQLDVTAVSGGYLAGSQALTVSAPSTSATANLALLVDETSCSAPGYTLSTGISADFSSLALPAGWTVVDNKGNGQVWKFNDPGGRGNRTGGSGGFAILDSDNYGSPSTGQDSELRSPAFSLVGATAAALSFDTDFNSYSTEEADVDVSTNGGTVWTNLWLKTGSDYNSSNEVVSLSSYLGQASVLLRFHYYNANFDWWWQVDNPKVSLCSARTGGMVVGRVLSGGVGALNGVTVSGPYGSVLSAATPEDANLGDGYYWLFAPAGTQTITAVDIGVSASVTVTADGTVNYNFYLNPLNLFLPDMKN